MKKLISVVAVASAIVAAGSLAMASSTTSETDGFTFSFNQVSFTQSDWATVSGEGYTVLAECPAGQKYVSAYVLSSSVNGGYVLHDPITGYTHANANGDVDGIYLGSGIGQGGQGNGTIELICAS